MKQILFFIAFTFFLNINAQKDLDFGNFLYENKAYSQAIPIFEKIIEPKNEKELLIKLASSYEKTKALDKAYNTILKYKKSFILSENEEFLYLEILKQNEKYDEIKQLEQSTKYDGVKKHIEIYNQLLDITLVPNNSTYIKNLDINNQFSDFSLINFGKDYLITSNRQSESKNTTMNHEYNNAPFYNMIYFPKDYLNLKNLTFNTLVIENNKFHIGASSFDNINNKLYFTINNKNEKYNNIYNLQFKLA